MPDPTAPTSKPATPASGSELPPRLLAKLKVEIEGYELIDRLGEGGQATVYKAIQKQDGQTVAVKVLHAGPHATEEARARLKREINALRAINHPNIVQAIAAGRTRSGLDCLVMNFIEGRPLDDLWNDPAFAAKVAPQPADVLRLFKTICETVQAAHRKGITHRDLSPSNILIDATGQPHILDFGMASTAFDGIVTRNVTVTGQFIGKLKYASPEQASGARTADANGNAAGTGVDIRSDVYALGVMLYQLLTGGAFPYEVVGNVIDVLNNIIHSKPRPPSEAAAELRTPTAAMVVPKTGPATAPDAPFRRNPPLVNESIEAIVLKALEKDPAQRYQSAGELAADIDRYLAGQPTSAVVWSARAQVARRPFRLGRPLIVAASVVLIATLVGVSMNAKTLAVWLGLATAAAPILPTELAPLAPSTAEAAMLAAQQPDGSERRLNDLAADLAKLDARLRAVHKQLAATGPRKPPELEERQPGASGPFPADELIAALTKSSTETGRPLTIEPLAKTDRDRAEQTEASAVERETDQAALLTRRATLDADQGALWARLSWGTFTGREADRLFRFRLKTDPTADANTTNKGRVLEAGVKVRRLAARAMDDAATALRVPGGGEGGEGVGGAGSDLGAVATTLAEQLRSELANFQKVAGAARDSGALKAEEAAAVAELQKHADRLRDALDGTAEMHARARNAEDELGRFTARDRLQRDLRDTADAAARLDAGLVKLKDDWKFDVDPTSPLRDAAPAVVRRPQPPARPNRPEPKAVDRNQEIFVTGDEWTGTFTNASGPMPQTWTVTSVKNGEISVATKNKYGTRNMKIRVDGDDVEILDNDPRGVRVTGEPSNRLLDIKVSGKLIDGRILRLSGSWSFTDARNNPVHEAVSYELTRVARAGRAAPAAADPAARVTVGSTWSGAQIQDWNGQRKEYQTDGAKIDSRTGNTFVLRTARPVANSHVLWTIRADGNKLTVVSSEPTNDPGLSYVIHESRGTINGDTMEFYVRSDSVRNGKVIGRSSGTVTLRRDDGK